MPENIVPSLFGLQPWQIQQQQNQGLQSAAEAYGNQTPAQRINSGFYQAGGMLGGAAAQGMGMVNPQVQQAQQMNQFMQGVDTSSSASIIAGARKALDSGLPQVAAVLNQMARTADAEEAKAQQERATSQLRYAETSIKLADAGKGTPEMQNIEYEADNQGLEKGSQERKDFIAEVTSELRKNKNVTFQANIPVGNNMVQSGFVNAADGTVRYIGHPNKSSAAVRIDMMGQTDPDSVDAFAKQMAAGDMPLYKGSQMRNPTLYAASNKAIALNPNLSDAEFNTNKAMEKEITSGQLGKKMTAARTANNHLDLLQTLADANKNGDVVMLNKARAMWNEQMGSELPTNISVAAQILGGEIGKTIAETGQGTGEERNAASSPFSNIKSPQQLSGAVRTVRALMGGKVASTREQFASVGKTDEQRAARRKAFNERLSFDVSGQPTNTENPVINKPKKDFTGFSIVR